MSQCILNPLEMENSEANASEFSENHEDIYVLVIEQQSPFPKHLSINTYIDGI